MDELRPTSLTWAALLSGWLDFARTAVVLPSDATGRAWRDSVAPIIRLQAVTFALGEIDRLAADELALAIDKAEILIDESRRHLSVAWGAKSQPKAVCEVLADAALALRAARAMEIASHRQNRAN